MPSTKLFQNATLITFNPTTSSLEVLHNHCLLIKDDRISAIAPNLASPPPDTEVIDCTAKILTPGFINTHAHTWQTAFRSLGPDVTLSDYFTRFGQYSPAIKAFSAEDVFVSALAGYVEGLNAGTTTVVEHAHANWDPQVVRRGYEAAVESGGRVWWCCAADGREGCTKEEAGGVMRDVGKRAEGRDALVRLGYAWDGFGHAAEDEAKMKAEKEWIRDLKIEAITIHHLGGPWKLGSNSMTLAEKSPATLQDLHIPIIFSHAPFLTDDEISALRAQNWNLSITPESEMHFGHGQKSSMEALDQASLGIDTAWTYSGDMLMQARIFLQHVRANAYQTVLDTGKVPKRVPMSVEDVFLLLTRQGGQALRRQDLGVLQVGAKADIAIFDTKSPNMAGWTNAVAAVILHANVGDVEGVLVDGQWRKKDRTMVGVDWDELRGKFEKVARRVQENCSGLRNEDLDGEGPFGGMMTWGEPEVFSTKRS